MRLRMLYHVSQTEMMVLDLPCVFLRKFLNELLTFFVTLKNTTLRKSAYCKAFGLVSICSSFYNSSR